MRQSHPASSSTRLSRRHLPYRVYGGCALRAHGNTSTRRDICGSRPMRTTRGLSLGSGHQFPDARNGALDRPLHHSKPCRRRKIRRTRMTEVEYNDTLPSPGLGTFREKRAPAARHCSCASSNSSRRKRRGCLCHPNRGDHAPRRAGCRQLQGRRPTAARQE